MCVCVCLSVCLSVCVPAGFIITFPNTHCYVMPLKSGSVCVCVCVCVCVAGVPV